MSTSYLIEDQLNVVRRDAEPVNIMCAGLPYSAGQRGAGRYFWRLQAPDQRRPNYRSHVLVSRYFIRIIIAKRNGLMSFDKLGARAFYVTLLIFK